MNQANENNQPKVLLLEAPKARIEPQTEVQDARKYGQNTGRDPINGQFLPGNPGKPLGARHFSTMLRETIREIGGTAKDGQKVAYDKIITKKMVTMAADGNLKAAGMVMDRVDGKVPQTFEVNKTERIGVVIMTPKEMDDHQGIFKRQYVKPTTNDNDATSDGARNENASGSTEGSAYESR